MLLSPAQMVVEYLTKQEVAEYMKVSLATLERLMRQGLPHIKLSRRVLFRKADVDRWLESKIVRGPTARRRA
jgi:excisionase family DNA binding protein